MCASNLGQDHTVAFVGKSYFFCITKERGSRIFRGGYSSLKEKNKNSSCWRAEKTTERKNHWILFFLGQCYQSGNEWFFLRAEFKVEHKVLAKSSPSRCQGSWACTASIAQLWLFLHRFDKTGLNLKRENNWARDALLEKTCVGGKAQAEDFLNLGATLNSSCRWDKIDSDCCMWCSVTEAAFLLFCESVCVSLCVCMYS